MGNRLSQCLFAALPALLLAGCASSQIDAGPIAKSDPAATAILAAAQRAQGGAAFARVHELRVRYEGRWAAIGPRFQPVLSDRGYRRTSEERLSLPSRRMVQEHTGPAGHKRVVRSPGQVSVAYDGIPTNDPEKRRAAALVADAYTLFLLGPFYFDRPGVVLTAAKPAAVDGAPCDQILAVLRPGFGFADEDRVVLSLDRATHRLRRVRFTLNGLESTRGAEVDVTFREFREQAGMSWPTDFDERIRVPFDLPAHHWRMTGLEVH